MRQYLRVFNVSKIFGNILCKRNIKINIYYHDIQNLIFIIFKNHLLIFHHVLFVKLYNYLVFLPNSQHIQGPLQTRYTRRGLLGFYVLENQFLFEFLTLTWFQHFSAVFLHIFAACVGISHVVMGIFKEFFRINSFFTCGQSEEEEMGSRATSTWERNCY